VRRKLRLHKKTSVVMCPTVKLPAEVTLGKNLESCSRWPELGDCAQTCTPQIQFSPESLERFVTMYQGEHCVCCGALLTAEDWYNNRLGALRSPDETPNPSKVSSPAPIASEDKKPPLCSSCYSARQK